MSQNQCPNILFVFSDQQRYSALGANGNDIINTPVLDAMAREGMVCDNMFSNHPLCSPYRAMLLTGRYGWQHLVIDNEYRPRKDIQHYLPPYNSTDMVQRMWVRFIWVKAHILRKIDTDWIIWRLYEVEDHILIRVIIKTKRGLLFSTVGLPK